MTNSKSPKNAWGVALDCLSRQALTNYELETRLKRKGYVSSEINGVLEKLEKLGYLNDQELALTFAESRLKRYSRQRVQQDLLKRGLFPELIEQALQETHSKDDEYQQCLALAKRWWEQEGKRWEQRINAETTTKKFLPRDLWLQQKVARKLVQRGYPSEMVWDVLCRIRTNISDTEMV